MSEEDLQNLPEPKETELIAESIELLEEGEQSQWMQKHSNDIQEENTSLAHSDCTTEGNVSMESTTDSIEAVSNALVSSTDTLLPQVIGRNTLKSSFSTSVPFEIEGG